jgi:hypothetical protein
MRIRKVWKPKQPHMLQLWEEFGIQPKSFITRSRMSLLPQELCIKYMMKMGLQTVGRLIITTQPNAFLNAPSAGIISI